MYVIQEVDEETFSERSRDKSQIFNQALLKQDQSVNQIQINENILEALNEEEDEDG
jgi:hypothetical protein